MRETYQDRIRELREERHLSQTELGEQLGLPQNSYSNYERGYRKVSIELLIRLCNFYNVSADYLLGLSEVRERR